jgi:hypothetical protein
MYRMTVPNARDNRPLITIAAILFGVWLMHSKSKMTTEICTAILHQEYRMPVTTEKEVVLEGINLF